MKLQIGVPLGDEMEVDPAEFAKMLPAEQVFEEMLPYLEALDAQIAGIIRLLKDKGISTNEELAKYKIRPRAANWYGLKKNVLRAGRALSAVGSSELQDHWSVARLMK
jgi:hypothetical protein